MTIKEETNRDNNWFVKCQKIFLRNRNIYIKQHVLQMKFINMVYLLHN